MNETKRMLALFGAVVVVIAIICLIAFWPEKDKTFTCKVKADKEFTKTGELSYENFDCLKDEDEYLIAVSSKISNDDKKALNSAVNGENGIYLVSLQDYEKEDAKALKEALKYGDNSFEKDVLIYVKDGKVKAYEEEIIGDKEAIEKFLTENGLNKFMCSAKTMEGMDNLGEIDYKGYECLYNQDKPFVLVLAQTTCGYCEQYEPVLNTFAMENNVPAYVINVDTLESSDLEKLTSSLKYFEQNESWGTPLTLGIKNKEVVGELSGYTDQTDSIKDVYVKAGILE